MTRMLKVVLPMLVIAIAVGIAVFLVSTRPAAVRSTPGPRITPVEVTRAIASKKRISLKAMGNVIPARTVIIQPEVGGRIIYQNKRLVSGGRFRAGEVMARINPRDYELALESQRANVTQAEFQIKVEHSRKSVAEYEWSLTTEKDRPTGEAKELALRNPHLKNTKSMLAAAKSGLERAELNVKRTTIRAPFNGMIRDESVEKGQLVSPQSRLATLVGTDEFWVQISIPVNRLDWFDVPGLGAKDGTAVKIVHEAGPARRTERHGRVVRLLGDLDPRGRMAQLIVSVEDPLSLKSKDGEVANMPLLLGSYVSVEIPGNELEEVFKIDRSALRNGNQIWIMDKKGKLEIRDVDTAWRENEVVYLRNGLKSGERIITSRIVTPIEGMQLRLTKKEPVSAKGETQ